jgi:sugar/nucleoside kinase (ribokinase family)
VAEVGCAGLLVEDRFCGPLPALPAEGALIVLDEMPERAGGCAANVAIDLAKQGISVDVVGCIGQNSRSNVIVRTFDHYRVGFSKVVCAPEHETSRTVILLVEGQDRRYLHHVGANQAFTVDHIPRSWLAELKVFYLGGLFALPGINLHKLAELLEFCRTIKVLTIVDVVVPQTLSGMTQLKALLPLIDYFVPNDDEARAFTGVTDPLDQLRAFERAGANTVIVTCGRRGSVALHEGRIFSCGAFDMKVVDPSGSGDAFAAGVIRSLLLGWDLPQTLRYANAVGASATRSAGTTDSVFTAEETQVFLAEHPLSVIEQR